MNAVIYVRHADKSVVNEQLDFCRQYAKDNGISVVREYIENTTNRDMEELNKIVKDSSSGTFNAVIIYTFERLGRNRLSAMKTVEALQQNSVRVISASENVNSAFNDAILSLMRQIVNTQKEEENL